MLLDEIKSIKRSDKVLRRFGFLLAGFLSLLGAFSLWKQTFAYSYLFTLALFAVIVASFFPRVLKLIYLPWMTVAMTIGWTITKIILTVVYYFLITPLALIAKILGKGFLDQDIKPDQQSYWLPRAKKTIDPEELEHQF